MRLYLVCNSDEGVGPNTDASLLGVFQMSAAIAVGAGENGANIDQTDRAIALLREALDLLDKSNVPSDVTARVQAGIDAVEDFRSD